MNSSRYCTLKIGSPSVRSATIRSTNLWKVHNTTKQACDAVQEASPCDGLRDIQVSLHRKRGSIENESVNEILHNNILRETTSRWVPL